MSNQPRISVVIPAYGCRSSIHAVIGALRAQSLPPAEIIVVNDCSPDGLAEELLRLRDHITILHNPTNLGLSRTFNRGLRAVTSDYVMTLHSDCVLAPDYLQRLWAVLDNDPGVGAVTGQYDLSNFPEMSLNDQLFCVLNRLPITPPSNPPPAEEIAFTEGKADLFRTRELSAFGFFNERLRLTAEDQELSARYRKAGYRILQINDATFYSHYNATQDALWKVLRKQFTYARGQAYVLITHGWTALRVSTRNRNARAFHRLSQLFTVGLALSLCGLGFAWPPAFAVLAALLVVRCIYYFLIASPMLLPRRLVVPFLGLAADGCYTLGMVHGTVLSIFKGNS